MRKFGMTAIAASVGALAVGAGAWFTVPYDADVVHATYAVDLGSAELAAGWADDIFVAHVESQESARRDADGLLYTPFKVEVKSTLQGLVSGDVVVAQEGGDDPITRQRVVFDGGAAGLKPGKTYILATRLSSQDGWHLAPSNFVPVELPEGVAASAELAKWKQAVASPKSQPDAFPSDVDKAAAPAPLYKTAKLG